MFIIEMEPWLFVAAAVGSMLVGLLAAVVPARRAARLDPVVAIRS
jgi:lipoprotein-releasing system permease protein